jgi:hypothetical protein
MTYLQSKIDTFYKKANGIFKKPLEKIINTMLNKCRYINGESLERHNWGDNPIKLKNIPENMSTFSFEQELLNALDLPDNEKSNVELLWGDIQLGKRVQACIIMWISVHILKRPVLYIFRNLCIDQKQLQDDIVGTEKYNFNIEFIRSLFDEFNIELQEYFDEINVDYWKDYKLPELKDINSNDLINKLSNKEAINTNDIFCCLMNYSQLAKIDNKFSEYIYYNKELVNMTVLVDESDLMAPTASNNREIDNRQSDSAACEILLAKIYKKVIYAGHITGTAQALLYNITTRLNDNYDIQIKISKVHKMKRSDDYYGLFNNSINFNTSVIESWWNDKNSRYTIDGDYTKNIKQIIETIITRPNTKYNSLLISEEKIRVNQFYLLNKIIKDFPNLFVIIYHGNCLRLYISQKYEAEIKRLSQWDSKQSTTNQRLWQVGGIYGSSIDSDKSVKLSNNYCYFDINTKILNIKYIYKLLRILFEKSDIHIDYKTAITITGKYGERGYSFTSDDYDTYSFHLTDQYFVSHASFNCTDISQRLRLQGKYSDNELKNGMMKLTLWTTHELQDIIENFYVKFIKEIERFIMDCDNWEDIKDLLENIIDNGELKLGKYMKYLAPKRHMRNIKINKHFDKKNKGYKLILVNDMDDQEISDWCEKAHLPEYKCINVIKNDLTSETCGFNKIKISGIPKKINFPNVDDLNKDKLTTQNKQHFISQIIDYLPEGFSDKNLINKRMIGEYNPKYEVHNIKKCIEHKEQKNPDKNCKNINDYNLLITTNDIPDFNSKKGDCFITYYTDKYKTINKSLGSTNPLVNDNVFITDNNKVHYSVLNTKYKQQNTNGYTNEDGSDFIDDGLPSNYYWKTPDGWLYLYDKEKPDIISLTIVEPSQLTSVIHNIIPIEPLINDDVLLFSNTCCKTTDNATMRISLKNIFTYYQTWCKVYSKKCLKTQKKFKEEFEKIDYKEEKSKGVDVNGKPCKKGYNIMVSL